MVVLRESSDPIVVQSSSIALLQERFRQLQRVKEMRQERELLRKLSHVPKSYELCPNATKMRQYDHEPISSGAFFFQFLPTKATPTATTMTAATISHLVSDRAERSFELLETPILIRSLLDAERHQLCGHKKNVVPACKFEGSDSDDVDTSLHL